jgi:hypothetical protein
MSRSQIIKEGVCIEGRRKTNKKFNCICKTRLDENILTAKLQSFYLYLDVPQTQDMW